MKEKTSHDVKRGFKEPEAANYIGMSASFLRKSRMDGDRNNHAPGPAYLRVGPRAIIYLREDLDLWLEQFRQHPPRPGAVGSK